MATLPSRRVLANTTQNLATLAPLPLPSRSKIFYHHHLARFVRDQPRSLAPSSPIARAPPARSSRRGERVSPLSPSSSTSAIEPRRADAHTSRATSRRVAGRASARAATPPRVRRRRRRPDSRSLGHTKRRRRRASTRRARAPSVAESASRAPVARRARVGGRPSRRGDE